MARALFRCDGATLPPDWQAEADTPVRALNHLGPAVNVNLRVENLSHATLGVVDEHAADLVRIGAYVYAADQLVRRGGERDAHATHWRRTMALAIPVSEPAFWNRPDIRNTLQATLGFASDDTWEFAFCEATPEARQLVLNLPVERLYERPDCVVLLSGGADSLCATVEVVHRLGKRPVLVSHRSNPNTAARQLRLVEALRTRFPHWAFPHISVWVHRRGTDAVETSQRTRAFLFAAMAAGIADRLEVPTVLLADNGIVSLNAPLNGQVVGAMASRSTHPKFLHLMGELVLATLPRPPSITNPLWSKPKADVLAILADARCPELLSMSVSCAHPRGRTEARPHCGHCTQCIDRRFAGLAAGLEAHDPPAAYEFDIFRDALTEGDRRNLAVAFYQQALAIDATPANDLFAVIDELYDAILPGDSRPDETATTISTLLKRQAKMVIDVMAAAIRTAGDELARQDLPEHCLVRLVAGAGLGPPVTDHTDSSFRHSADYHSVNWGGEVLAFNDTQATVVRLLHEAFVNGTPEIGQHFLLETAGVTSNRLQSVFKRHSAFGSLIVPGNGRGTYRLSLASH